MSQLQALRAASSLHDVASLVGFSPSALAYIVYKKPTLNKYKSFDIPKRGGGLRTIKAPVPELKLLQKNLSVLLQNCIEEINTKRGFADTLAHGFKRKRSIISNADRHRKRGYVFNIDLEDFFGTINFGRVRGFFIKDANFMLAPPVATLLAQIACHENALPQGSPCSPVISNLIGHILDIRLSRLAASEGCVYSRYADDISFSTNKPTFPPGIARQIAGDAHKWESGAKLQKLIAGAGFAINPTKTRMQYRGSRQSVTGLLVNKKVNIRSEYRRTVRAMAQRLFMRGEFEYESTVIGANGASTAGKVKGHIEQLHGMFGHIDLVDRHNEEQESKFDSGSKPAKKDARDRLYSKQAIYRRFLIFKDFYSVKRPVVVCEGKTDNIYLRHALKSLGPAYPKLASVAANNKVELKIRILKTLGSCVGRVLGLGRGYSSLNGLIEEYVKELKKFKAPGMEHPVILLADNDDGGEGVLKVVTGITKVTGSNADPFVYVMGTCIWCSLRCRREKRNLRSKISSMTTLRTSSWVERNSMPTKRQIRICIFRNLSWQNMSEKMRRGSTSLDSRPFSIGLRRLSMITIPNWVRQR